MMSMTTTPPITREGAPLVYSPLGGGPVRATRIVHLPDTPRRAIATPTPAAPVVHRPAPRAPVAPPAPTRTPAQLAIAERQRARTAADAAWARAVAAEKAQRQADVRHAAEILSMHRGRIAPAIPAADAARARDILALVPRPRGGRRG